MSQVLVVLVCFAAAVVGQEVVSDCPVPNGFFADSQQCDKYYECVDNVLTEKLCPDGMAFNDLNHRVEKCDFNYQIDCSTRPDLQPPQATEHCPRANGYFPVVEPGKCNEFYYCTEGKSNHLTCPESLVFSLKTGTCVWPDEAGRTDEECKSSNVVNFTCPSVPAHEAVAHPRYADPVDCQYFYVCINGKTPRRNGCNFGQVFNTKTGACDSPKEVPECAEYYFDFFTEYFAGLGDTGVPSSDILAAAINSGFPVPELAKRIRVKPSGNVAANAPRRRKPSETAQVEVAAQSRQPPAAEKVPTTTTTQASSPRRRPQLRQPGRRTTTTTTTTTPAPLQPELAEGDYAYYDYPEAAGEAAEAPLEEAPVPQQSETADAVGNRFSLRRPSRS